MHTPALGLHRLQKGQDMQETNATRQHTLPLEGCPTCGGTGWTVSARPRSLGRQISSIRRRRCWCCYGTVISPGVTHDLYWKNEKPPGEMHAAVTKYLKTHKPLSRSEVKLLKWYICQCVLGCLDLARNRLSVSERRDFEASMSGWKEILAGATRRESLIPVVKWLLDRGVTPL